VEHKCSEPIIMIKQSMNFTITFSVDCNMWLMSLWRPDTISVFMDYNIQIKYCPFCGKNLEEKT
jgi:hypothetical protein